MFCPYFWYPLFLMRNLLSFGLFSRHWVEVYLAASLTFSLSLDKVWKFDRVLLQYEFAEYFLIEICSASWVCCVLQNFETWEVFSHHLLNTVFSHALFFSFRTLRTLMIAFVCLFACVFVCLTIPLSSAPFVCFPLSVQIEWYLLLFQFTDYLFIFTFVFEFIHWVIFILY